MSWSSSDFVVAGMAVEVAVGIVVDVVIDIAVGTAVAVALIGGSGRRYHSFALPQSLEQFDMVVVLLGTDLEVDWTLNIPKHYSHGSPWER